MVSLDAVFECPECGVSEGQVHKHGCQSELCPFCGRVFAPEVFGCCEYEVTSKTSKKLGGVSHISNIRFFVRSVVRCIPSFSWFPMKSGSTTYNRINGTRLFVKNVIPKLRH